MKPHRSLAFLFVALLAIGCDPIPGEDAGMNEDADVQLPGDAEPRGDADVRVEPRLALGTGEGRFNTFEDGQTLDLVSGCQGAQHVWVALRAWGIDRRGPIIDVELIRDSDGERVSQVFRVHAEDLADALAVGVPDELHVDDRSAPVDAPRAQGDPHVLRALAAADEIERLPVLEGVEATLARAQREARLDPDVGVAARLGVPGELHVRVFVHPGVLPRDGIAADREERDEEEGERAMGLHARRLSCAGVCRPQRTSRISCSIRSASTKLVTRPASSPSEWCKTTSGRPRWSYCASTS